MEQLAKAEAQLVLDNLQHRNINQKLKELFPDRAIDAIKGKRRGERYKATVENWLAVLRVGSVDDSIPLETSLQMPELSPVAEDETHPSFDTMPILDESLELIHYLSVLNGDASLGPVSDDEIEFPDRALLCLETLLDEAKDLCLSFLRSKTNCSCSMKERPLKIIHSSHLSSRRKKQKEYAAT